MQALYSLLFYLLLPFLLPYLCWRNRRYTGLSKRCREWLGFISKDIPQNAIWLHAASVGEVRAALPLFFALKNEYPEANFFITTQTMTGQEVLLHSIGNGIGCSLLTIDCPRLVKRFITRLKPKLAIILETEIWPNLLKELQTQKVPVFLANARLSTRSLRGYQRVKDLFEPALQSFQHILAQTEADALRFIRFGLMRHRVSIAGNLKCHLQDHDKNVLMGKALRQRFAVRRSIWLAASIHPWEEASILKAFREAKLVYPELLLFIVPRHPQRFETVYDRCLSEGFLSARFSRDGDWSNIDILVGDVMGQLSAWYYAADLAFVGGSLGQGSGHNLLEPAAAGIAIITGSETSSFADVTKGMSKEDALIIVNDEVSLTREIQYLITEPVRREQLAKNARTFYAKQQGALQQHMEVIRPYLD